MKNKILVAISIAFGVLLFLETIYLMALERNQITAVSGARAHQKPLLISFQDDGPVSRHSLPQDSLRRMQLMQAKIDHLMAADDLTPGRNASSWPYTFTMQDSGQAYLLRMLVPGLSKKEINLELDGRYLKISGAKQRAESQQEEDSVFEESQTGSFVQVITLPLDALGKNITSEYNNHVLTVNIPKKNKSRKGSINIPVR